MMGAVAEGGRVGVTAGDDTCATHPVQRFLQTYDFRGVMYDEALVTEAIRKHDSEVEHVMLQYSLSDHQIV